MPRDFLRTRLTVVMHYSGFRVRYIVGRPRCDAMSDDVGIQKPEGQRKAPSRTPPAALERLVCLVAIGMKSILRTKSRNDSGSAQVVDATALAAPGLACPTHLWWTFSKWRHLRHHGENHRWDER